MINIYFYAYFWVTVSQLFDNDITDHQSGLDNAKYPIPATMKWADLSWSLWACSISSCSLNAGHYTSMVRHGKEGKYTLYNDDFVTEFYTSRTNCVTKP